METPCKSSSSAERRAPARDLTNHANTHGQSMLDTIHGVISMHPLLAMIINTRHFQRLRYIRMLGPAYFSFHTGNQNRFEHCIGVSYLAGKLVESLQKRQPELAITEQDCLCVAIAGLCHDLGHGPLSHTFERFLREADPSSHWEHENVSVEIMHCLMKEYNLMPHFEAYGMAKIDLIFIEELIHGKRLVGRPKEKSYLYEIVANKRNGVDVDRIDYIYRDIFNVPVVSCPDFSPIINTAKAILVEGEWQLCYDTDAAETVFALFNTRRELHRRLYQEEANGLTERMVIDAMLAANNHLLFTGADGVIFRMSECVKEMSHFLTMNDSVIPLISQSSVAELKTARDLLERVFTQKRYAFIGMTDAVPHLRDFKLVELKIELARRATTEVGRDVKVDDVVVIHQRFDYGMGKENPMDFVYFYEKGGRSPFRKVSIKEIGVPSPQHWYEEAVIVYYKGHAGEVVDAMRFALEQWAAPQHLTIRLKTDCFVPRQPVQNGRGNADVVSPDMDLSTIREELWGLYQGVEPVDKTIRSEADALKALDSFEASNGKSSLHPVNSSVPSQLTSPVTGQVTS